MQPFYPEIFLGPPGCSKTTTLLNIVDEELKNGCPPDRIAFLSFTRRAAEEGISRACEKFNTSRSSFPYFRTIHSLAFHLLGLRRSEVIEGPKLQEFAKWIGIRITGHYSEDGLMLGLENGDKILFLENLSRITGTPIRTLYNKGTESVSWSEIERVIKGYRKYKEENGLVDFTDMLELYLKMGTVPMLQHLICDEVQDQTHLQWQVVEKLAKGVKGRIVLAGDDDQAIFEWAGADVPRLINQPGKVSVLGQSYRVPSIIQDLSNSIIRRCSNRRNKQYNPREGKGIISHYNRLGDCDLFNDRDVLILARNTYILKDQIEPELRQRGVIYEKNGYLSIKENILSTITNWERLRRGESIPVNGAIQIYDLMSSGIGIKRGFKKLPTFNQEEMVSMDQLKISGGLLTDTIWHQALDRIPLNDRSYIIAARRRGESTKQPRVRISTIHGAKGSEANTVLLFKEQARKTHQEMEKSPDQEHRVFYVGATRAKEKLVIIESPNDRSYPWI